MEGSGVFSQRSAFERQKNRLELARLQASRAGHALLDLTESNPTRAGFPSAERLIAALARPEAQHYEPLPFGLASAREAVSRFMVTQGQNVAPERIVLTASTSEAYAYLFKLLCDPDDAVLIPAPSYPLFEHLARLENVRTARYPLAYDGRWHVLGDALKAARTEQTRAIVTVHPNNPTGSFLKVDELAQLAALGVPIISDEVFAPYAFGEDHTRAASASCANEALVFTLHGLSKLVGLPQLKLSWICVGGPSAHVDEALGRLEIIADSFLSVSTPVQLALPEILQAHAPFTEAIATRLTRNLRALVAMTQGTAVSALHVEGGWYATLRMPDVLDDEAWALDFLSHAQVLVQPGYFYDFEGGPFCVVSLLTLEAVFANGMERLLARVRAVLT